MDAVGADDDVGLDDRPVRERNPSDVAALLEADTAMIRMHDMSGQSLGQKFDEIGTVHPERRIPAG